jgi:hypothetical protein
MTTAISVESGIPEERQPVAPSMHHALEERIARPGLV